MATLTIANQITLLRMLLIPAFVIQVLYGQLGWALATFITAGITDALDGLIARRAGQKTTRSSSSRCLGAGSSRGSPSG